MSLQFPSSPTEGQRYQPSGQPQIYTYSGGKWAVKYNAQTASNADFATSASQAENSNFALTASYALNGGGGGGNQDFQSVTTAGGLTSASISISASLANGVNSIASGQYSHAEGVGTTAAGYGSHAEGLATTALGKYSHTAGRGTLANADGQNVVGKFNIPIDDEYAFIVGNGGFYDTQNNLLVASNQTVQVSGSLQVKGGITGSLLGTASYTSNSTNAQTASYVSILGDGITVNYSESGIELTGSAGSGNLDAVLAAGRSTSGSIIMGENPYWPYNWAATASLAIGSGSLSLTSHSIALGLNSVAGNPNSIAIGNGSVTGRYLYDDGSILGIDQSQVRWTGLGLPTPPVDWFKVGKSYIAFGDEIALTEADIRKAIIINNVTSVQSDMLGRLTVNHSGLTGNNINAINSTKPRIWIEIDSAPYSFAQGEGVFSAGASQHVIGQYNSELSDEGALIVGNGADKDNRSNLLVASGDKVQITGSLWVNGTEITGGAGVSASYAQTASYVSILGDGITVNYSEFGIELTGSGGGPTVSASHADMANTASYVSILGDGITVNYSEFGIELTGSGGSTPTLQAVTDAGSSTTTNVSIAAILNQGASNTATGQYSHAEGVSNTVTGDYSHVEGSQNNVSGIASHAEGQGNNVIGAYSKASGYTNTVLGTHSNAEGMFNYLVGNYSHVEGFSIQVDADYAHAQGTWNVPVTETGAFAHGIGTGGGDKRNLVYFGNSANPTVELNGFLNLNAIVNYNYPSDNEAALAGIPIGGVYHHNGVLRIRHT